MGYVWTISEVQLLGIVFAKQIFVDHVPKNFICMSNEFNLPYISATGKCLV